MEAALLTAELSWKVQLVAATRLLPTTLQAPPV